MKINIVSLEDGITATGFRKIAAYVEKLNPDTHVFYVGTRNYRSLGKYFTRKIGNSREFTSEQLDQIAAGLANADIVALSCMTGYSALTKQIASRVRKLNPSAYIIWGGIHPIIYAEDAITADVDAICNGEGELAFEEFFEHFKAGTDYTNTRNFWFRQKDGTIKKNMFRPLMNAAELERLPFPKYGGTEWIYDSEKAGYRLVTKSDYLANNGLAYPAIWSIGCPLHCTFCGNTVFIANDANYRKVRHTSPAYIIGEIKAALKVHPHLRTVLFYDDSFMAIPLRELTDFSQQWREEVGLPFCVYGVIPTYVQREKMEMLTWGGMNRVRMGIQSGSERILKFYRRPTPLKRVEQAAEVIAEFAPYQINPAYDIIVDNPIETRQDVIDTLELVYRLARPFTLNIFSLRVIPNTVLEKQMEEHGVDIEMINANYTSLRPTWANVLLYLLMVMRPPRRIFDLLLKRVRAYSEPQSSHDVLIKFVRMPWLVLQGMRHLRHGEFSVLTGWSGYVLWRIGALQLWKKLMGRKLELPAERLTPAVDSVS